MEYKLSHRWLNAFKFILLKNVTLAEIPIKINKNISTNLYLYKYSFE